MHLKNFALRGIMQGFMMPEDDKAAAARAAAEASAGVSAAVAVKTVGIMETGKTILKYIGYTALATVGAAGLCWIGGYSGKKGVNYADSKQDPLGSTTGAQPEGGDGAMSTAEAGRRGGRQRAM